MKFALAILALVPSVLSLQCYDGVSPGEVESKLAKPNSVCVSATYKKCTPELKAICSADQISNGFTFKLFFDSDGLTCAEISNKATLAAAAFVAAGFALL